MMLQAYRQCSSHENQPFRSRAIEKLPHPWRKKNTIDAMTKNETMVLDSTRVAILTLSLWKQGPTHGITWCYKTTTTTREGVAGPTDV